MTKRNKNILKSKVSLAPMAGITDCVLRSLIRNYSKTCLLTSEMISSEGLAQVKDVAVVKVNDEDSPIAFQISGHKPHMMADAARFLEGRADIIDINMGCPVKKVVGGHDGAALMNNIALSMDIVKAVKDVVKIPVSVKFRLGFTMDSLNYVEFGQAMQEAGAEFITIHARTRSQMYSGKADWLKIKDLKNNVDIPVFANGDIVSVETAARCLEESNADGVAIGRGILGDVSLISRIEHYFNTGEILEKPDFEENIKSLIRHIDGEIALRGENVAIKFVRKFYPYYISGLKNAAKYRQTLVLLEDYEAIISALNLIVKDYLFYQKSEALL